VENLLQRKDKKRKPERKFRRSYRKPHLHPYGSVKNLTAGGTGSKDENRPHPQGKDKPAKKLRA